MIFSQKYTKDIIILSCGGMRTHECIHNCHIQGTTLRSNQSNNEFTIGIWNGGIMQVYSKHEKFHNIDKRRTLGGSQEPF
jgi:hypothetical protein